MRGRLPFLSAWLLAATITLSLLLLFGCSMRYAGPERIDGGVRFSVKAPGAKKVMIAGNFNEWDTEKDSLAGPDDEGLWNTTLPLSEGRYEYLFLVDGEKWMLDPDVPSADDGMGGRNSVLMVR